MLYSISRPVSYSRTPTDQNQHHQGAPVQTLLKSLSRPVSLHPTDTKVIVCFQTPTRPAPSFSLLANFSRTDLILTDQARLCLLVRNLLLFNILIDGTVFQVLTLRQKVTFPTGLQSSSWLRKANFQRIRTLGSRTHLIPRNKRKEKL